MVINILIKQSKMIMKTKEFANLFGMTVNQMYEFTGYSRDGLNEWHMDVTYPEVHVCFYTQIAKRVRKNTEKNQTLQSMMSLATLPKWFRMSWD